MQNDNAKFILLEDQGFRLTKFTSTSEEESFKKVYRVAAYSPLIQSGIELFLSVLLSNGYTIEGKDAEKMQTFLDENNWDYYLPLTLSELLMIGNSYWELLMDDKGRIHGMVKVENPLSISIKKEAGNYMLDERGTPLMYVQETDMGDVDIEADRILHFKLLRKPGSPYGHGMVERILYAEMKRIDTESMIASFSTRLLKPFIILRVTDDQLMMSERVYRDIQNAMSQFKDHGYLAVAGGIEVETEKPSLNDSWVAYLKQLSTVVLAGMGIPKALLYGEIRTTPGLVEYQLKAFDYRVRYIKGILEREITEQFRKIFKDMKFKINEPDRLSIENTLDSIAALARAGVIAPEDVRSIVERYIQSKSVEEPKEEEAGENED